MLHRVRMKDLVRFDVGPAGSHAYILNGEQHGLPSASLMLAEIQPNEGAGWHRHSYDELFVIHDGHAFFTIGEETVDAKAGQIVLVPAGMPHTFVNDGEGVLRQTAVHVAPKVAIEWLDM